MQYPPAEQERLEDISTEFVEFVIPLIVILGAIDVVKLPVAEVFVDSLGLPADPIVKV